MADLLLLSYVPHPEFLNTLPCIEIVNKCRILVFPRILHLSPSYQTTYLEHCLLSLLARYWNYLPGSQNALFSKMHTYVIPTRASKSHQCALTAQKAKYIVGCTNGWSGSGTVASRGLDGPSLRVFKVRLDGALSRQVSVGGTPVHSRGLGTR